MNDDDWRERALCAQPQADPDLWYDDARAAEAIAICAGCPVLERCRASADAHERGLSRTHIAGVWGGEHPRDRLRRGRHAG
jgi:hypothetical protein